MKPHFKLRDYQQDVINKVNDHLSKHDRCCVSLATGGGKTFIFSELVNMIDVKTLICVHREELVNQTSNTLKKDHDILIPKTKILSKDVFSTKTHLPEFPFGLIFCFYL